MIAKRLGLAPGFEFSKSTKLLEEIMKMLNKTIGTLVAIP